MNVELAAVDLLWSFQTVTCLNSTTMRQSTQQRRCAKACPPRLASEAVTAHSLHMSSDAIIVIVPVLAMCLRWGTGSFFRGQNGAQGTIGTWVVFGTRPTVPVAREGHVPDLQTKKASWCSTGQESSRTRIGSMEVGGRGNVGTRLTKAFM